jgi:hypothetical protein
MSAHWFHRPHGSGIRGLNDVASINLMQGRFGRLFPTLKPAQFANDDLVSLAGGLQGPDANADDGFDPEESHIPAAYTYFGQVIDHDLTFDPSTFQQQQSDPNGIVDFRTPRFDLDNLYGRGPSDQPYLYDDLALAVGSPMTGAARNPNACDLPRATATNFGVHRAIIGDPRNDENTVVSQLHGLLLRFHNAVVAKNAGADFATVQQQVRWHYQWIVLHDFLPRIVAASVLDEVSPAILQPAIGFDQNPADLRLYHFPEAIMPVEFSVAAYRLGHSMVRPGYRVNENLLPIPIFDAANPENGLNAFGEFPAGRAIDWQRFVDLGLGPVPETDTDRVQFAYKIDTSMVEPLGSLPASVAGPDATAANHLISLAYRNLLRGVKLRLPSGQDVAHAIGATVMTDDQIYIGSAETGAPAENKNADGSVTFTTIDTYGPTLKNNTPLWVYVLAESRRNFFHGPANLAQLGEVGGRIVTETFLGLLLADQTSLLNAGAGWTPTLGPTPGQFTLPDLIRIALA